ncbi:molybdopterin cofactor-binding domain-containing protein [Streptomyces sp. NPDC090036]|uniref:molybdopterin cofactor-binding domain-containing protein n=1 Tax=Streptomyces sp. NPDC090036 TaxID=3365926 RepID=UPI0038013F55
MGGCEAYGSPRSVTSHTQGFRIAVHRVTGEIRILYSVQAADAGVLINPEQVRGQVEGSVAQGLGFAPSSHPPAGRARQWPASPSNRCTPADRRSW